MLPVTQAIKELSDAIHEVRIISCTGGEGECPREVKDLWELLVQVVEMEPAARRFGALDEILQEYTRGL